MLNEYINAVRQFCELQAKRGRTGQFIRYQILADEVNDPTLVSLRAYGVRSNANVVMVAAGTNGIWEQLPETEIILPLPQQLQQMKSFYGVD